MLPDYFAMADPSIGSKRLAEADELPEPKKAKEGETRVVRVIQVNSQYGFDKAYDCMIPEAYLNRVKRNAIFSPLTPDDTVKGLKKDLKRNHEPDVTQFKLALLEKLIELRNGHCESQDQNYEDESAEEDTDEAYAAKEAKQRSTSYPPAYCTVVLYMGY